MGKSSAKVYISLILAMLFWGFTYVWFKVANRHYSPSAIVFFRLTIASVFLLILSGVLGKLQKIRREDYRWVILMSLFNPFFYFLGESFGLSFVSPTVGSIVIATIPLATAIAASYFYRERLTWLNKTGMLVSFFGILIMVLNKNLSFSAEPKGLFLLLFAVLSATFFTLIIKRLTQTYNAISLTTYQNIIGVFLFLPIVLIFDYQDIISTTVTREAVISVMELAIFGSTFAFILFTYGLKMIGASRANVFSNIIPVCTAILAYFTLKEEFTLQKITGISLVITGLFMAQVKTTFLRRG